jgi:hypothetical protein
MQIADVRAELSDERCVLGRMEFFPASAGVFFPAAKTEDPAVANPTNPDEVPNV